jgi:hypothetical protein
MPMRSSEKREQHMRKAYRWLVLLLFLVANGLIITWAWRTLNPTGFAPVPVPTAEEQHRAVSEHWGRTDQLAYDLIAQWKRAAVIKLDSQELDAAIERLPEAGCIDLPDGGIALNSSDVPRHVKQDLDAALTGFLRATGVGTPDALIDYMRGRGEVVDPKPRAGWQKGLSKSGVANLEKLSDEQLYRAMRTTFNLIPHWSGLAPEPSCRQLWDAKQVSTKSLKFDASNLDPNTPPAEQAEYLLRLFKGTSSGLTNFVSTSGSLQDSRKSDKQVLLCDVQLIIEFDEAFSHAKSAYLFRLWFNPAVEKWQPVDLIGFASEPDKLALPHVGY